jgi:hypothetical protein
MATHGPMNGVRISCASASGTPVFLGLAADPNPASDPRPNQPSTTRTASSASWPLTERAVNNAKSPTPAAGSSEMARSESSSRFVILPSAGANRAHGSVTWPPTCQARLTLGMKGSEQEDVAIKKVLQDKRFKVGPRGPVAAPFPSGPRFALTPGDPHRTANCRSCGWSHTLTSSIYAPFSTPTATRYVCSSDNVPCLPPSPPPSPPFLSSPGSRLDMICMYL